MKATVMYGAGDVRIENVTDARIIEPTDALVIVTRAAICGSDRWPYKGMKPSEEGRRMGHDFIGIVVAIGAAIHKVKVGDIVASSFAGLKESAFIVRKICTPLACKKDSGAVPNWMAEKGKRCTSLRRMGFSILLLWGEMTPYCPRFLL